MSICQMNAHKHRNRTKNITSLVSRIAKHHCNGNPMTKPLWCNIHMLNKKEKKIFHLEQCFETTIDSITLFPIPNNDF